MRGLPARGGGRLFSEFKQENFIQVKGAVLQLNNRPALEALANY